MGQDPKTFNPWTSNDASSSEYAALLFEGLFDSNPDTDEIMANFAESWQILEGGRKIIVKMRDDLYWSDGEKIDADDLLFTWNTLIRDRVAISSLRDVLMVEGQFPDLRKIDELRVSFSTVKIFAPFLKTLGIAIAPKHDIERFFKEHGAVTLEEKQKAFNNYLNVRTDPASIVSSGPFRLARIKHGERIEFARNDKYFGKDDKGKPLPYLDKIVYSYVQDQTAAVFKFLAGESHVLAVNPENAAFIKSMEKKYNFTLYDEGPSTGTSFLWFNLSKNIKEPKYSWFNNLRFREAVSLAIDRESIVNNVFQGLGAPLFTAESLKSPFVNEKLISGYKRDTKAAAKILEENGFKLDKDGVLRDAQGHRVEFDLFTNAANRERELMSSIIIDNLKELGIKVNFKSLEFNNFVSRISAGKDYEAGILSFTGSNEPNSGANVWKTDGRLHIFDLRDGAELNLPRDWEKRIDRLFEQGVQSLDFKERKKTYDEFQEIVYEYNPFIYLASPKIMRAINNDIQGIKMTKYEGILPLSSFKKIYLRR
jgi:peptide/nickel transport system substrate-binding protein